MSPLLQIRIHPEGWVFVGIFTLVAFILFYFSQPLGWIGLILTAWCAYFFRNPKRVTPTQPGLMVSPADGIVCAIRKMAPPAELGMGTSERFRVSVFLNVFDVHVNRLPIGGKVVKSLYQAGKFLNAASDQASDDNERQTLVIEIEGGITVAVVQIAGLIARRILCDVKEGDTLSTGIVYGLIRFGSRTDIYLPEGVSPQVIQGQRMIGGESIIADLNSKSPQREGVTH
jgi:phosphatidylserine decarboxylase